MQTLGEASLVLLGSEACADAHSLVFDLIKGRIDSNPRDEVQWVLPHFCEAPSLRAKTLAFAHELVARARKNPEWDRPFDALIRCQDEKSRTSPNAR